MKKLIYGITILLIIGILPACSKVETKSDIEDGYLQSEENISFDDSEVIKKISWIMKVVKKIIQN